MTISELICIILASAVNFIGGYILGQYNEQHFEALDISEGEWRPIYQGDEIIDYRCNKCEFGSTFGRGKYRFNYCPNCGARMKAGE